MKIIFNDPPRPLRGVRIVNEAFEARISGLLSSPSFHRYIEISAFHGEVAAAGAPDFRGVIRCRAGKVPGDKWADMRDM